VASSEEWLRYLLWGGVCNVIENRKGNRLHRIIFCDSSDDVVTGEPRQRNASKIADPNMTVVNPLSNVRYEPPHRLIVKARVAGRPEKGYIWEIVRLDQGRSLIRRSAESCKTMEEAYTQGSIALGVDPTLT
jgi:hypothetical protein